LPYVPDFCPFWASLPYVLDRKYFLQEVFVRFYFPVKITAGKVNNNFAGDKAFTFCPTFFC